MAAVALLILFWPRETEQNETVPLDSGSVEIKHIEGGSDDSSCGSENNQEVEEEESSGDSSEPEVDKPELKL